MLLRKWSFCVKRKHVCSWDMHVCLFSRWGRDITGLLFTLYWPLTWVQFSSVAQLCLTLCDSMDCNTPGFPAHHQLLEPTQTHVHWVVMPPNHLIPCRPFLFLPSIFPSIRIFYNESALHIRWPKYWYLHMYPSLPPTHTHTSPQGNSSNSSGANHSNCNNGS